MLPQREGKYIAYPAEIIINETGRPPKATVTIRFAVTQYLSAIGPAEDVPSATEITGYFYLEDNSGAANAFTVKALTEALGWDGVDTDRLLDPIINTTPVQIVVMAEEYGGKTRMKVKYLNPASGGGAQVERPTPEKQQSIRDRMRAKLAKPTEPATATPEPPPATRGDIPF